MKPDLKNSIAKQAASLEEIVRQYSKDQKELWQRVPYLAFMAERYRQQDDQLESAYKRGYWSIYPSMMSLGLLAVDCETGELYDGAILRDSDFALRPRRPASGEGVLRLAYHTDMIDAQKVIDALQARIRDNGSDYGKPRVEAWREGGLDRLGLDENKLYKREDKQDRPARDDNQL
jgi:hypothetical protein